MASTANTARSTIRGLRELANWIEVNEEMFSSDHMDFNYDGLGISLIRQDRDEFVEMSRVLGGKRDKVVDEIFYRVRREFGPIRVDVLAYRENVCEKVVTGTRTVTETVPDPGLLEAVPLIEREREEEIVEWICAPLLSEVSA